MDQLVCAQSTPLHPLQSNANLSFAPDSRQKKAQTGYGDAAQGLQEAGFVKAVCVIESVVWLRRAEWLCRLCERRFQMQPVSAAF